MRRTILVGLLSAAVLGVGVPAAASAAPSGPAAAATAHVTPKKKRRPACVRVRIGGRSVCARVGAACQAGNRSAYLERSLDCVLRRGRRRIAKATPAAIRRGRYIALPASGRPTQAQALAAFDASVAAIPGIDPPRGTVGATQSGTTALRWMNDVYYDLATRQQRSVTNALLAPRPGFSVPIDENGAIVDPNAPPVDPAPAEPVPAQPASAVPPPDPAASAASVRARAAQVAAFEQIVREAIPIMAARGVRVRHPVFVRFYATDAGATLANAFPWYLCTAAGSTVGPCTGAAQAPTSCAIGIFPRLQGAALAARREFLVHELTHCAQFEAMGSLGEVGGPPQWMMDGTADYVAQTVSQAWSGSVPGVSWWSTWLREPEAGLFTRGYDAVGFWHLLDQKGVNVYALIDPLVRASVGGSSAAAYATATAGVQSLAADWGPTSVSLVSNPAWKLNFPYVPSPPTRRQAVTKGSRIEGSFARYGGAIADLDLRADIIIVSTDSDGRLLDSSNTGYPISGARTFCTRPQGCTCPDEPDDGTPRIRAGQAYLGVADTGSAGGYRILGQSLDEHCKPKADDDASDGPLPGASGPGLTVTDLNANPIGNVTRGTCSVQGSTFVARGSGSAGDFLMRIAGASGPGSYTIPIGSGTTFVQVGNFTSNRPVQGFPGGGSADIARVRVKVGKRTVSRWRISVGVTPLFSVSSSQPAASIIPSPGGLIC